jgi:Xaa-Pro aminopeptidase
MEYEIEAEFIHEFMRNRSKVFPTRQLFRNNANVLHYVENNQQCKSGDLILIDAGAEYANYSSDMTRTIPVSGKYNDRQKFTMPFYALRMKLLKCLSRNTLETVPYRSR